MAKRFNERSEIVEQAFLTNGNCTVKLLCQQKRDGRNSNHLLRGVSTLLVSTSCTKPVAI